MSAIEALRTLPGFKGREDSFTVKCPGHDDRENSLQVKRLESGKLSVQCFANCPLPQILEPIGLHPRDLYPPKAKGSKKQIDCCYNYVGADGKLIFQVVRYRPKSFSQRQPDKGKPGGWAYDLTGVRRVLYRHPEVLKAKAEGRTVYLVEGEKDADNLADLGLCATTNAGGAAKWEQSFSDTLSGADVVILPDNDKPGIDAAWRRHDAISGSVVVMLPGLPSKGDVSDWLAQGGTTEQLAALVDQARTNPPQRPVMDVEARPVAYEESSIDPLGELAGAHILLEIAGDNLRHTSDRGWLWFDDTRFTPAEKKARRMATKVGDARRKRGHAATDDPDLIKAYYRAAKRDESAAGIEAILKIASTLPGIDADHVEFDADPWALNFYNGTVNLQTGELRPHRRDDFLTKICPHPFDPSAQCPRWLQFIDEIFCGNRELISWVQWLVGYSFTGSTHRHLFPILHGDGRNGKGAFFRAIRHALGADYSCVVETEDLMAQNNPRPSVGIAALRGVRFAYAQETEQGRKLNEALIKTLTGGDVLKARVLYGQLFEFKPTHKLWMATNYRPRVTGTAAGIWDRLRLIPFERRFLDHEQDPHLDAKLEAEVCGILAWAVQGARMDEPPIPACVRAATDSYRDESDVLAAFIDEVLIRDWQPATTLKREVYEAFRRYTNNHCESMRDFNKRLVARGFEDKHTERGTCWTSVSLHPEWQS